METAHRIAMGIMIGEYDCGISFGVERMGPLAGPGAGDQKISRIQGPHPRLMERNSVQRDMAHDHFDYFSVPIPDFILDSPANASMVQTAQNVIEMYDLSRKEMDAFAVRSHKKLAAAYEAGFYKDEVLPLEVEDPVFDDKGVWLEDEKGPMVTFDTDECLRHHHEHGDPGQIKTGGRYCQLREPAHRNHCRQFLRSERRCNGRTPDE